MSVISASPLLAASRTAPANLITSQTMSLWLGGRPASLSLPDIRDESGEIYSPALDLINATFGSTLRYDGHEIRGASGDGQPLSLAVSNTWTGAQQAHIAYVAGGQVYVPLHELAKLMGSSFAWDAKNRRVSLMPRLTSIAVVPTGGGSRIQIHSTAPLGFVRVSYYDSPWRIVLDINGARTWPGRQLCTDGGLKEVRWKEYPSAGHVRIVAQLKDRLAFNIADSHHATDYWLDIAPTPALDAASSSNTMVAALPRSSGPDFPAGGDSANGPDTRGGNPFGPAAPSTVPADASGAGIPAGTLPRPGLAEDPHPARPGVAVPTVKVVPPAAVSVIPVKYSTTTPAVGRVNDGGAPSTDPVGVGDADIPAPTPDAAPLSPQDITSVTFRSVDSRSTEITVQASGPIAPHPAFYDGPARLVLDVPNATLRLPLADQVVGSGGVEKIRTGNFPEGSQNSRIVVDLKGQAVFRVWSEHERSVIRILIREPLPVTPGVPGASVVAGRTICIDPGHCSTYTGCRGYFGLKEEEVSLDVGLRLRELLVAAGAKVVMTRTTMAAPAGGRGLLPDLLERASIGNRNRADLFLSIHCNAMPDGSHGRGHGAQAIYSHPYSAKWANIVYHSLADSIHGADGLHYRPHIKVTEYSQMPAALGELGYLDTKSDAQRLANPAFRQKEAEALFHAFEVYFRGAPAVRPETPDNSDQGVITLIPAPAAPTAPVPAAATPDTPAPDTASATPGSGADAETDSSEVATRDNQVPGAH